MSEIGRLPASRRSRIAHAVSLICCLATGACAQQSRPVTVGQALQELQRELAAAGAVSAVGADPNRFADGALAAQCAAHQADPEVPLLAHDLTVNLAGSFSATGGFTVGSAAVGLSLTGSATRGQTQELELPLSFVALSEIPASVAAQRLIPLAALPERDRRRETARVLADRNALRARIAILIRDWSPGLCQGVPTPGPFHPNLSHTNQTKPLS